MCHSAVHLIVSRYAYVTVYCGTRYGGTKTCSTPIGRINVYMVRQTPARNLVTHYATSLFSICRCQRATTSEHLKLHRLLKEPLITVVWDYYRFRCTITWLPVPTSMHTDADTLVVSLITFALVL